MPEPKVTSLFLKRAVRDLERLKGQAEKHGDDVSLLAYLINMALVEARERLSVIRVFGTASGVV